MEREELKQYIDKVIIEHLDLEDNYFSSKVNDGENILIQKELLFDPLDSYEILSIIENKYNVLLDETKVFNDTSTYGDFIDGFWNEIQRKKLSKRLKSNFENTI